MKKMIFRSAGLAIGVAITATLFALTLPLAASDSEGIPNALSLPGDILVGGQPSEAWLAAAASEGYSYIVDLRGEGEDRGFDEPARVEELGMSYVPIPIAGVGGLTEESARQLDEVLAKQREYGGKLLVHCASGNRVGALFALRSFFADGAGLEEAIRAGNEAGLTRLEDPVREILEAAAASTESPDSP